MKGRIARKGQKNMKRILSAVLAVLLFGTLCACGGKSSGRDIDIQALAQELVESGAFSDVMSPLSDNVAKRMYDFEDEDAESFVLYTGTGATAEEIFLVKATGDEAQDFAEACRERVSEQKTAFKSYVPEEVTKLDAAILETVGDYVILVVAADAAAARAVVDSYIG